MLSQREPDNSEEKYSICVTKENKIVGHLPLGRSAKFNFFPESQNLSSSKVTVTGKPLNVGDGDGMPVPCMLIFFWSAGIDILKYKMNS